MTEPDLKRKRDSTITKHAILASARRLFADKGFDSVGLREIAAGAGVTAMMVNRYFGSKEQLFAEVLAMSAQSPTILTAENLKSDQLSSIMAKLLIDITATDTSPLEGFKIMLHSASSKRAAQIGREQIELGHYKLLASVLKGEHVPERTALALALVAGVQVMRQMIALPALANAEAPILVKLLTTLFQSLIEPSAVTKVEDDT